MSSQRRVVVTGIGIISPLGDTKEELWGALSSGRSGVAAWDSDLGPAAPIAFAAAVRDFAGRIEDFGPLEKEQQKAIRKGLKVMCRECQMGVAAAQRALSDARITPGTQEPDRIGISFGSDHMITLPEELTEGVLQCLNEDGEFDFSRWAQEGMPKMSPLWLLKYLPNMPASHLAIYNDFRGPNNSLTLREAAANVAVAEAYQIVAQGRADLMLCGTTGTRIHPIKLVHALQQEELCQDGLAPEAASRPFDLNRTGMVLGEGAAALVLEEQSSAVARGATIYAEVLGGASSSVAGRNLVARRGEAMKNAMLAALRNTGISPEAVGHVHAHGLSTRSGDIEEAWAIREVFGGRSSPVPVTAAKSYFGNLGAGSGMVEMIASILSLQKGCLFATLNYQTPDPDCPVDVVASPRSADAGSFLNLSVTPQGQASAALLRCPTG